MRSCSAPSNEVMAELYGKGTGIVKGKGGSMHLFDVEDVWGGYGIVGGHIPLGVGMAYAKAYKETGITFSSISATARSTMARTMKPPILRDCGAKQGMNPCLFVLENNQYGMGTSVERATANTT